MKRYLIALVLGSATFVAHSEARIVELKAEAVAGKTHWSPERIEAVQGETDSCRHEAWRISDSLSFPRWSCGLHACGCGRSGSRQEVRS